MPRLNEDNEMIERMEVDLSSKAQAAFVTAGVSPSIHGVFSLDDLERKTEEELCQRVAVGVGYWGAKPHAGESAQRGSQNTAPGGNAVKMVDFVFMVILAVPHGENCLERYSATRLLTVLRRGINGSTVSGDATNRTWTFVSETPNITESTDSMLYYTQVWRVTLPAVGL